MGLNSPGVPSNQLPPDEAWLVRRVADLERTVRELGPSVAASFKPVIDDLTAKQAALNDLLTKVVKPQSVYFTDSNFAVAVAPSAKASTTITVPAGFTSATVSVTARIYAANPNTTGGFNAAGGDFLYAKAVINGVGGSAMPLVVLGSGSSAVNVAPYSTVLPGLTGGGTFTITALASTAYLTWAANTSNVAEVSGTITWYR